MSSNIVKHIETRNCGGYGAWMDNPLSSPSPGSEIWPGFQLGGGSCHKYKRHKKSRKSRKSQKSCKSRKYHNKQKSLRKYKKTRRNI